MGLLSDETTFSNDRPRQRYGGTLIHSDRDADGILEVVETHCVRSLHFGTSPRQSALSLTEPDRLELSYIRAMLIALLFIDAPLKVLLLGLGGGTLARFLLIHYPDCQIDAVERRAGVANIAHRYFGLPRDTRLRVHIAEAAEYIENLSRTTPAAFDLILVDAYDHQGMDSSINAEEFFSACRSLLHPQGAFSINLWGTHSATLRKSIELLNSSFPSRAFKLAVPNKGNVIGLGLGAAVDIIAPPVLSERSRLLEIQLGVEMPYFFRILRKL